MPQQNARRRCGAFLLACGLVLGACGQPGAAPLLPSAADRLLQRSEPFSRAVVVLAPGALRDKWQGVAREIEDELVVLALCEEDRNRCASPAAGRLLDIIAAGRARDGRARLGEINRALNLAVRASSDLALYGADDVWQAPLALLTRGASDCEDYAIAKYVALRAAGVAAQDLRILITYDVTRGEDHAVAAVRQDGRWWLLDNRRMAMVEDVDVKREEPRFVIDDAGVRQYRDAARNKRA